jgi:hypothetical protein
MPALNPLADAEHSFVGSEMRQRAVASAKHLDGGAESTLEKVFVAVVK